MSKAITGILVSGVMLTALVVFGATVDDKSVGTATYTLTENGTVMSLQVDRIVSTFTNSTLSGGTITGAVQATGSTLTGPTVSSGTFSGGTVTGSVQATGSTLIGPSLTNYILRAGTITGAVNVAGSTLTAGTYVSATVSNLSIDTLSAAGAGVSGFITNMPAGAVSTNACIWLTVKYGTNWVALPGFQVGAP